jgi:Xaa-Pro aminopeptidase
MASKLIVGDTFRSPELRHEVPLGIIDPFLYAEHEGRRFVVVAALECDRIRDLGQGLDVAPFARFGIDELVSAGREIAAAEREVFANACAEIGVREAVVPAGFPVAVADDLRRAGITITVDQDAFDERRRVKTAEEVTGIRRAQCAADAGTRACVDALSSARATSGGFELDGQVLTVELLKARIEEAFLRHGATADEFIVARGAQAAVGHDMGSGAIAPGEPIVVDIWPRDRASACFADMTRTFVLGGATAELREYHRLVKEALELAVALVRPGADGRELYGAVCDHFEAAGYPTGRTKADGEVLRDGFFHGLGHGVGLEVHERPWMGRYGDVLVQGDVITVEPGLYRAGYGGVRLEDLALVTVDGCEILTDFPYDMEL